MPVHNLLKDHGIEPAPQRKKQTTWRAFLNMHWEVLAALDFATIEVWTQQGLSTFYLLLVLEPSTRRVELAGFTIHPTESWMVQSPET